MNKKDVLFTFVCILIVAVIMIGGVFITVSKDNNLELKEEVVINYDEFSKFENDIFKYKYEKKMKPREIAEALNVPVNKVYSAIERIKGKIKSHNDNNKGDLLDKKRDF